MVLFSKQAEPKSMTLIRLCRSSSMPFNSTFSGFRSQWMMLQLRSTASASRICTGQVGLDGRSGVVVQCQAAVSLHASATRPSHAEFSCASVQPILEEAVHKGAGTQSWPFADEHSASWQLHVWSAELGSAFSSFPQIEYMQGQFSLQLCILHKVGDMTSRMTPFSLLTLLLLGPAFHVRSRTCTPALFGHAVRCQNKLYTVQSVPCTHASLDRNTVFQS